MTHEPDARAGHERARAACPQLHASVAAQSYYVHISATKSVGMTYDTSLVIFFFARVQRTRVRLACVARSQVADR